MSKKTYTTKYIREIMELTSRSNECPNFKSEGEPFWKKDANPNIFKAHPDAAKGILYKPYPDNIDDECEKTYIKKRKR